MTATRTLVIIGTAGRKEDGPRLSLAHYRAMCALARGTMAEHEITHLVSGGAAWADHVAVTLTLEGAVNAKALKLYLPAKFHGNAGFDRSSRDGSTADYYQSLFKRSTGIDYRADFRETIEAGASVEVNPNGFLARNLQVAAAGDVLLAFTFGNGAAWTPKAFEAGTSARNAGVKDGGTAHTFDRSRAACKIHVALSEI